MGPWRSALSELLKLGNVFRQPIRTFLRFARIVFTKHLDIEFTAKCVFDMAL